eukprot:6343916-Prymnesium_polylepis.2
MPPWPLRKTESGCTNEDSSAAGATIPDVTLTCGRGVANPAMSWGSPVSRPLIRLQIRIGASVPTARGLGSRCGSKGGLASRAGLYVVVAEEGVHSDAEAFVRRDAVGDAVARVALGAVLGLRAGGGARERGASFSGRGGVCGRPHWSVAVGEGPAATAAKCGPVSYTHLTLPTICSV